MAFTLALVSFSCTGPLIGTLLVEVAVGGNYLAPAIGMFGFSSALAFPFAFLSFFPSLLQKLPRSGAWLNRVKVILGFIEIALALKFLSVVDLAYHWNFLTREIFIGLWIALFTLLGFYLLGLFRFSHDSPNEHTSISSFFLALFSFAFCVYLLPGMFGAPLRLLSGIAPPRTHSEDQFRFIQGTRILSQSKTSILDEKSKKNIESAEVGPHGLAIYKDYEMGRKVALANHQPILLDFTGFSCVNCRKMEDNIWSDPSIFNLLQQFVIISLYVDDKKELPESEQYISPITQKKIRNIGNKWSDFQIKHYQTNSQPYYVALEPTTEKKLHTAVVYLPDVVQYAQFLQKSLDNYQAQIIP
jgi:thiol:disulfide interchange protein DsbD